MGEVFSGRGLARWLAFFAGWVVLGPVHAADLAAGVIVSGLAAAASLRLLPQGPGRLRLSNLLSFAAGFMTGSFRAGWDVARRVAVVPPRVRPGIVTVPCAVPEGLARDTFRAITSLQPGMLPLSGHGPELRVHCLDVTSPVAASLSADAAAFLALADAPGHGTPHG